MTMPVPTFPCRAAHPLRLLDFHQDSHPALSADPGRSSVCRPIRSACRLCTTGATAASRWEAAPPKSSGIAKAPCRRDGADAHVLEGLEETRDPDRSAAATAGWTAMASSSGAPSWSEADSTRPCGARWPNSGWRGCWSASARRTAARRSTSFSMEALGEALVLSRCLGCHRARYNGRSI